MKGYKGIQISKGVMRSFKGYIFEIGPTYYMDSKYLREADKIEQGFHYCKKMEHVLRWRNYLEVSEKKLVQDRLFEVEILGNEYEAEKNNYCTDIMRIVREIPKDEIIDYINDTLGVKESIINKYGHEVITNYEKVSINPYKIEHSDKKILENFILTSACYVTYHTGKPCELFSLTNCKECEHYRYLENDLKYYYYALVRNALLRGENIEALLRSADIKANEVKNILEAVERLKAAWEI